MRPRQLAEACAAGTPLPPDCFAGCSGRVCRGADEAAFRTLHPDGIEIKPFSWVVGTDGLEMLLGGSAVKESVLSRLRKLGFVDEWIHAKLLAGEGFRVALFPRAACVEATWDGIMQIVASHFPSVAPKVLQWDQALRETPFETIQGRASAGYLRGATYFEINEAAVAGASDDDRFMSTTRLASDETEGTLEEVRGWLYHVVSLNALFDGRGWTKDPRDGRLVVREYLTPNVEVATAFESEDFGWVDLDLTLDDLPREQ
jgi:hypothetical protein